MTSYTTSLNMKQENLMQPGLKYQQDWIVLATLLFGGAGAINLKN